ncbi:hypothetical protein [Bosea sp. 117]|uniref:hypothetical protein n=1 Tax=Bosea sp. 117 TaxID=1125973 RepID=UPI0004948C77|nr:hypothetical protein [Bosea sp. 117]
MSESDERLLAKLAELKRRRLEGPGAAQPAGGIRRGLDGAGNAGGGRRGAFLRELLKERGEGGKADGAGGKRGEVLRRILERRAAEEGGEAGERPLARLIQRRLDERGEAAGAVNTAMSPAESAAAIERLEQLVSRLEGRLAELDGKSSGGKSSEDEPNAGTGEWPSEELPAPEPAAQVNRAEPRTGAAERIAARRRADAANKK